MGNDGVLTTKDFLQQKNVEKSKVKAKKVELPKDVVLERKFMFEPAPMGEASTVITFEEKLLKIKLVDKVYTPPKNWSENKLSKLTKVLQIHGFLNVSEYTGKGVPDNTPKRYLYIIGHPDNAVESKVNAKVSIKLRGQSVFFQCEDGKVETEDEDAFKAFLKKGWYEVSKQEIKEDN